MPVGLVDRRCLVRRWVLSSLSILSFAGLSLGLVSCSKSSESSDSSKPRIGFILDNMQEERYAKDKKYFTEAAEALGAEVIFASSDSSTAKQMDQVENMIVNGVKTIVIQPVDSKSAKSMVEKAKREGIAVIAYDRIIEDAPLDLYVTQDSFKVGVLQAEAAVQATGRKGNFVILSGAQGHSVAESITRGVFSVLEKHPEIKVVVHQYHEGWSTKLALNTVENALTAQKDNVQAILANNSGMARGAVQAVSARNLSSKVFIAGADADLTAIKDIVAKRQHFEVLKAIEPLARSSAEAAVKLARGEKVTGDSVTRSGVQVINTPVFAVTPDNLEETIIQSGFHTREAVFGQGG